MFLDASLTFTGGNTGSAQAITSATVYSTGVLDLATGAITTASTFAAAPNILGNATVFGETLGEGRIPLELIATVGTAFTSGGSYTLQMIIQAAPDNAAGSYPANISGLSWTTLESGPAINQTYLTANAIIPGPTLGPTLAALLSGYRFMRLGYVPSNTFTGGTVAFAAIGAYPSGFKKMAQKASGFTVGA